KESHLRVLPLQHDLDARFATRIARPGPRLAAQVIANQGPFGGDALALHLDFGGSVPDPAEGNAADVAHQRDRAERPSGLPQLGMGKEKSAQGLAKRRRKRIVWNRGPRAFERRGGEAADPTFGFGLRETLRESDQTKLETRDVGLGGQNLT